MQSAPQAVLPIAMTHDQGEALWFLGALTTIKASGEATAGRVGVLEVLAPKGHASPLHVHTREDEWFYVMEGSLAFLIDGKRIDVSAGGFIYGPRNIQHTFTVTSEQARFLIVAEPAGFESFMREVSEKASTRSLPGPDVAPPDPARLATVAAEYGIEILGPPGIIA